MKKEKKKRKKKKWKKKKKGIKKTTKKKNEKRQASSQEFLKGWGPKTQIVIYQGRIGWSRNGVSYNVGRNSGYEIALETGETVGVSIVQLSLVVVP
ncbi:hypothetical protein M8J77_005407 [Diaphorina citri]|nr:hypothetical protein M8J77_005407 [Diaphorina citri]